MWTGCFIQMNDCERIFVRISSKHLVSFIFVVYFSLTVVVLAGTSEEDEFTGKAQTYTSENSYYIWIELLGLTFAFL